MATNDEVQGSTLDQVRNILFGEQQRKSEQRIGKAEEALGKQLSKLRSDLTKRIDALKAEVAKRTDELSVFLDEESSEREGGEKTLEKNMATLSRTLEARIGQSAKEGATATKDARAQAGREVKELRAELEGRISEIEHWMEENLESLRETHVSKEELSAFFADFALRLVDKKQIRRE